MKKPGAMSGVQVAPAWLRFRRQFIVGPQRVEPGPDWRVQRLERGLVASWHPDLEVHAATAPFGGMLMLFGFWVDSTRPERDSFDILLSIVASAGDVDEIVARTDALGGRWALLYSGADASFILNDACGLRTIFHHRDVDGVVRCASQPELLRTVVALEPLLDADLERLRLAPEYALLEGATFGPDTTYAGVKQLQANHRLDLDSGTTQRFFPRDPIPGRTAEEVALAAGGMLRGSIVAMARRGKTMMPVTAGWDSRVLLAASRPVSESIRYYVHRAHRPAWDVDIRVPRRLMRRLGLPFRVNRAGEHPPGDFAEQLKQNVTSARVLSKTRNIYFHYRHSQGFTNLNGNGGEVGRQYFRKLPGSHPTPERLTSEQLAEIVGFPGQPFVVRALDDWRAGVEASPGAASVDLLDLLYWEQRMWKWGAQFPAEQDMAVEEFSPFNSRALLSLLLSAPEPTRRAPDYPLYRRMIELLWPECLTVPINPVGPAEVIIEWGRRLLPSGAKVRMKRLLGR